MGVPYEHIVDFGYCKTCEYWEKEAYMDPCYECLNHSTNYETKKPVKYEAAAKVHSRKK